MLTIKTVRYVALIFAVLILASILRFVGINWDQNHHLHPDERFLTMVAGAMKWPSTISEYLDTAKSPVNPHNIGYSFYVYGTFPLIVVRVVAEFVGKADYNGITIIGRIMMACMDIGTMIVVFLIAKHIGASRIYGIVGMLLYALSTIAIQLSHFFAVDPFAVFFTTISIYLVITGRLGVRLGLSYALAVSSKISALWSAPAIGIGILYLIIARPNKRVMHIFQLLITGIVFLIGIRLAFPYLFEPNIMPQLNRKVLANWTELKHLTAPNSYFPPAVQWIPTKPYLFPLEQLFWYGLGVSQSILSIVSIGLILFVMRRFSIIILLIQIASIFGYEGMQTAKTLRYFYPLVPALSVVTAVWCVKIVERYKPSKPVIVLATALLLIWPISFVTVYTRPHTRITASEWIYTNIPKGSTLAGEAWDDYLPLSIGSNIHESYTILSLSLNGPDTPDKWTRIREQLQQTDYIVLSSNRSYGSIGTVPHMYPQTSQYYQSLFDGTLGFRPIAQFTSRPTLPIPFISSCVTPPFQTYGDIAKTLETCDTSGMTFVDDYAEELWTVYDHPKVIIFQKQSP